MRIKNYDLIFFALGIILQLINSLVEIKALFYIGCICVIISPFLPGGFLSIDWKKSAKKQEKKEDNLQETQNITSPSIEKDPEQDNLPPS